MKTKSRVAVYTKFGLIEGILKSNHEGYIEVIIGEGKSATVHRIPKSSICFIADTHDDEEKIVPDTIAEAEDEPARKNGKNSDGGKAENADENKDIDEMFEEDDNNEV